MGVKEREGRLADVDCQPKSGAVSVSVCVCARDLDRGCDKRRGRDDDGPIRRSFGWPATTCYKWMDSSLPCSLLTAQTALPQVPPWRAAGWSAGHGRHLCSCAGAKVGLQKRQKRQKRHRSMYVHMYVPSRVPSHGQPSNAPSRSRTLSKSNGRLCRPPFIIQPFNIAYHPSHLHRSQPQHA